MSIDLIDIYHTAVIKLENKGFEPKRDGYVNINMLANKKDYTVDIPVCCGDNQLIFVSSNDIMKYISRSSTTKCASIW